MKGKKNPKLDEEDINSSFMFPSCSAHALNHPQRWYISIKAYDKIYFHDVQTFFTNRCCNNDIVFTSSKFLHEKVNSRKVACQVTT